MTEPNPSGALERFQTWMSLHRRMVKLFGVSFLKQDVRKEVRAEWLARLMTCSQCG